MWVASVGSAVKSTQKYRVVHNLKQHKQNWMFQAKSQLKNDCRCDHWLPLALDVIFYFSWMQKGGHDNRQICLMTNCLC